MRADIPTTGRAHLQVGAFVRDDARNARQRRKLVRRRLALGLGQRRQHCRLACRRRERLPSATLLVARPAPTDGKPMSAMRLGGTRGERARLRSSSKTGSTHQSPLFLTAKPSPAGPLLLLASSSCVRSLASLALSEPMWCSVALFSIAQCQWSAAGVAERLRSLCVLSRCACQPLRSDKRPAAALLTERFPPRCP